MQTGKVVTTASTAGGKFILKIEKRTIDYVESIEADYLFIASGSSQQVCIGRSKNDLHILSTKICLLLLYSV